jgi:hypothetical protein
LLHARPLPRDGRIDTAAVTNTRLGAICRNLVPEPVRGLTAKLASSAEWATGVSSYLGQATADTGTQGGPKAQANSAAGR